MMRASRTLKTLARRKRIIDAARRAEIRRIAKLDHVSEERVVAELIDYSLNRIHRRRTGRVLPAYITFDS